MMLARGCAAPVETSAPCHIHEATMRHSLDLIEENMIEAHPEVFAAILDGYARADAACGID